MTMKRPNDREIADWVVQTYLLFSDDVAQGHKLASLFVEAVNAPPQMARIRCTNCGNAQLTGSVGTDIIIDKCGACI